MSLDLTRRAVGLGALGLLAAGRAHAAATVRIGYQKNGSLVLLQQHKTLESAGMAIDWVYFTSGPPMLEALHAGAIDFAATGDTPPIFAQAAGSDLLYVAGQPMFGAYEGILVKRASSLHTLSDLRGKRVAYTKGSSGHFLILAALAKAGLTTADIEPVTLAPPDAAAAFAQGRVDAWGVWDPFLAVAEQDSANRILIYEREIAISNRFFLARRAFAEAQPQTVHALIDAINHVAAWAKANPDQLATTMAQVTGVPMAAERVAVARDGYVALPMSARIVAEQQNVADTFLKAGVLPHAIRIADAVWSPSTAGASK